MLRTKRSRCPFGMRVLHHCDRHLLRAYLYIVQSVRLYTAFGRRVLEKKFHSLVPHPTQVYKIDTAELLGQPEPLTRF